MKTVIITGANGNLGKSVTEKFLEVGYRVIATVRNESGKNELTAHPQLHIQIVNLDDETAAAAFSASCTKAYKIDALLMLVGGFAMGGIKDTTGELIRKQYTLNFETAYFIARPVFQHMIENRKGRLVFIGSRPALEPEAGKNVLAYALSKSLLFNLATFLNAEGKGKNVTASVIAPAVIDTPLNRKDMPDADYAKWVKPAVVAELLAFIVSEKGEAMREMVYKVYGDD